MYPFQGTETKRQKRNSLKLDEKCLNCLKSRNENALGLCVKCTIKLNPTIIIPRIDNELDVKNFKSHNSCNNCNLSFQRKFELRSHKCPRDVKRRNVKAFLQKFKFIRNKIQCRQCFKWFPSKERRNR